jgi:hypothetical protein
MSQEAMMAKERDHQVGPIAWKAAVPFTPRPIHAAPMLI